MYSESYFDKAWYDWKGEKQTIVNKILNSKFDQRDIRHSSFAGGT